MTAAFRAANSNTALSNAAVTINDPGNAGDLLIAIFGDDFGAGTGWAAPDGTWTKLSHDVLAATVGSDIDVFYKTSAVGSGSYTFTNQFTPTTNFGVIAAYSGADPNNPINVFLQQLDDTATTDPWTCTGPSITTTSDGCLIVWIGGISTGDNTTTDTFTAPSGYTKRLDATSTTFAHLGFGFADKTQTSAGNVSAAAGTDTRGGTATAAKIGYLIGIGHGFPSITTWPQSQTVVLGSTATFTVAGATSGGTLHYQWKQNGSNVGTDSSSYTTPNTDMTYNGALYSVNVSDDNGTVSSGTVVLTVAIAPSVAWFQA